jgi:protein arginine phosphatase
VDVWSRGVLAEADESFDRGSAAALQAVGMSFENHRAAVLTGEDVQKADAIIVMEAFHQQMIAKAYPAAVDKIFFLKDYLDEEGDHEIADPHGGSPSDYEKCRIEIQNCLLGLIEKLK